MHLTSVELLLPGDGRVARMTVPGGPLSMTAARELVVAADSIRENRDIRVVVVAAAEPPFCSGPAEDLDTLSLHADPASALATLRPPVVCAIDGDCRAEGLELALATDIRVVTPEAVLALDHLARGRVPAWGGTQRLPRAIRPGIAVAAALLGTEFDADTALDLGLVHSVTDRLDEEVDRMVEILVGRGPLALELTKEAVHRGSELPLRDGLRLEGDLNHQLAASADRAEGLAAFFERRPPDFGGR